MNEIYTYSSYAVMVIKHKGSNVLVFIDIEDVDRVQEKRWNIGSNGYICSDSGYLLLHRFLTNAKENEIIDHVSGNPLDNTRLNLRACTSSENSMNRISITKTGVKNVSWDKQRQKWKVNIKINGKTHSKRFDEFIQAIEYRNKILAELHGEFARDIDYLQLLTVDYDTMLQLEEEGFHYVFESDGIYKYVESEKLISFLKDLN